MQNLEALKRKRKNAELAAINKKVESSVNDLTNSDSSSDDSNEPPSKTTKQGVVASQSTNPEVSLPSNFFDKSILASTSKIETQGIDETSKEIGHQSGELPKGFFDNPVEDAKARHEPFKNPMDEEWEKFQRVMAVESYKADNLDEEDLETLQVDRDVDEVEEQLSSWTKIDQLQKKAEELLGKRVENDKKYDAANDDDTSDEDFDFDSWRNKSTFKSKKAS